MINELVKKIEWVLDQDVTSYRMAKETGLSKQFIDGYRKEPWKIKKMSIEKAEVFIMYAEKLEKKVAINDYRIETINESGEWESTLYEFNASEDSVDAVAEEIMKLDMFTIEFRVLDNKDEVVYQADGFLKKGMAE